MTVAKVWDGSQWVVIGGIGPAGPNPSVVQPGTPTSPGDPTVLWIDTDEAPGPPLTGLVRQLDYIRVASSSIRFGAPAAAGWFGARVVTVTGTKLRVRVMGVTYGNLTTGAVQTPSYQVYLDGVGQGTVRGHENIANATYGILPEGEWLITTTPGDHTITVTGVAGADNSGSNVLDASYSATSLTIDEIL